MISGISGTGNAFYMAQMRRAASNTSYAAGLGQTDASKSNVSAKSQVSMEEIFSRIDADGNGVISKDEFDKAKSDVQGRITDSLTTNQSTSSLLSLLEASKKLNSSGNLDLGAVQSQVAGIVSDQVFSKLDTNGDGVVSRDELTQILSGAGTGSGSLQDKESIVRNAATQTNAIMAQVVNRYTQFAQSGPVQAALGSILFTG